VQDADLHVDQIERNDEPRERYGRAECASDPGAGSGGRGEHDVAGETECRDRNSGKLGIPRRLHDLAASGRARHLDVKEVGEVRYAAMAAPSIERRRTAPRRRRSAVIGRARRRGTASVQRTRAM
jgi:hypothetical protein